MNNHKTNRRLLPKTAIIVYADKKYENYYLESREIKGTTTGYSLMAAKPMPEDAIQKIAKNYMRDTSSDMNFGGVIAGHLLYCFADPGSTIVAWYRPAMERVLNINFLKDQPVKIPALLYVVVNKKMYVYALADDRRPDLNTKLFYAPYYNVYSDGNVCLGTAPVGKTKAKTFEKEADRFERGFYMAEQLGGTEMGCKKTKLDVLWKRLAKTKAAFPSKVELKPHATHKTFGALINNLIRKNS